jgi:hypothetical protein
LSTHDEGHPHLIAGEFQSDKYPTCPRGKVPLSCKDPTAQDLLWQYAQRRRSVDAEFAADLELALKLQGYQPPPPAPNAVGTTTPELHAAVFGQAPPAPKAEGGEVSEMSYTDFEDIAVSHIDEKGWPPRDRAVPYLVNAIANAWQDGLSAGRASLAAELEAVRHELAETSTMLKRNQEALHRLAAVPAVSARITVAAPVATAVDAAIADLAEKDRRIAAWAAVLEEVGKLRPHVDDAANRYLVGVVGAYLAIPDELRPGGKG